MNLGITRNQISHRQSSCLILIAFYILMNNIFTNAEKTQLINPEKMLYTDNTREFAIDLLGAIIERNMSSRVVFSSFSIQTCLGVINLALGSNSKFEKYLPTNSEFERIFQLYGINDNRFRIASKFFYKKGSSVLRSFNHSVVSVFRSTSDEMNTEYLQAQLSRWLKNEGMPSTTTFTVQRNGKPRLSFTTLMNFSVEWLQKFSKNDSSVDLFITKTENGVILKPVRMMNIVGYFDYASLTDLKTHVIKLPFSDKCMSMLIFVPHLYSDVNEVQKELTAHKIREIIGGLVYRKVSVKLPKFSVDSSVHYTDTLSEMGLRSIFCGKMYVFENREFLRVQSIVQNNKFVISEDGINRQYSVGASMNTLIKDYEIKAPSSIPEFHANRPFIFFIQDNVGRTFYAGKVTNID